MIGSAFDAMRSDAGRFGDGLALAFRANVDDVEARAAMMLLAFALQRMGAGHDG